MTDGGREPRPASAAFKRWDQPPTAADAASAEIAGSGRIGIGRGYSAEQERGLPEKRGASLDNPHGCRLGNHRKDGRDAAEAANGRLLDGAVVAAVIAMSRRAHAGCHRHLDRHLAGLDRGQIHPQGQEDAQEKNENPSSRWHGYQHGGKSHEEQAPSSICDLGLTGSKDRHFADTTDHMRIATAGVPSAKAASSRGWKVKQNSWSQSCRRLRPAHSPLPGSGRR